LPQIAVSRDCLHDSGFGEFAQFTPVDERVQNVWLMAESLSARLLPARLQGQARNDRRRPQ
jgi:hypothetical protein